LSLLLSLLPEREARAALAGRALRLRMLLPPFRALGVGTLRVLRVSERDDHVELTAGYDRYERVDVPA
jgi:hypothetical protein